jgi:preprotein translocase subunit SecY
MFLMWLGEQITERGIGNGISMIILASIVSGLPSAIGGTLELMNTGEISAFLVLFLIVLVGGVTYAVVFMERGQRRITVHYAKRMQGRRMLAGQATHLPFKINMSGVIPPIFASSIILFPATIASWFGTSQNLGWLQTVAAELSPGQPMYDLLYGALILFFCFFYTALVFDARETADNLKRSGAFLPGIRPGQQTADYIDRVLTRLTFWGGLYVMTVCLLPQFMITYWKVPFYFGGTSLLIIVVSTMVQGLAREGEPARLRPRRPASLSGSSQEEERESGHESTSFGQADLQELQGRSSQRQGASDLFRSTAQAAPGLIPAIYWSE